jgi:hypothetical protein
LSKTSVALRRIGVAGVAAATIGTGLAAFAGPASAAASDITALKIVPPAAAISTGEDTCQLYTITSTEGTSGTATPIRVVLQPTGSVNSQFCNTGGGTAHTVGANGQADSETVTPTSNGDGTYSATIGVNEAASSAGQIQITAFQDNTTDTPSSGAPTGTALETIISADAQNDIVTSISASPSSANATVGTTTTYKVTVVNGSSNAVQGAQVYYSIKSSQGNSTGSDNTACTATNQFGVATCTVTAPPTTSVQSGPYTVTFKVPQNASGQHAASGAIPASNSGPTTTATLTTSQQAPSNATVALTCGGSSTERTTSSNCTEPTSKNTETFTATVTTPGATAGTTNPVSGVVVQFFQGSGLAAGETSTLNPTSCITDSTGSCSTTVTVTPSTTQGDFVNVGAQITTTAGASSSNVATVTFNNNFQADNSNISVKAASATANTGSSDVVTATVTNQFGNPSSKSTAVTFTISGVGTFSNGQTTQTVNTGTNGQAQVTVTSNSPGTSTVTASLAPSGSQCTGAGENGNCSASTTITWSTAPSTAQSISVTASPNPGTVGQVETATATVKNADGSAAASGETVTFTVTGANAASGTAPTNSSGVATFSYTPTNAGTDNITVSVNNSTGPASTGSTTVTINNSPPPTPQTVTPSIRVSSTKGHVHIVVFAGHGKDDGAAVTFVAKINGKTKTVGKSNLQGGEASISFAAKTGATVTAHAKVHPNTNANGSFEAAKTGSKTVTVK